ncbi:sulfatase [Coraliomargarita algicola]|uniref:Sulfatase n=1 Tax=Coraliomargarita algicola TaxID=3092156 RepID=A0ABZ0RRL5_9BACT|nr:sulfatase [Coraliomargarita sp. J2-16]WPJ97813.1 sulfatase [Coraliomargarita sp. J2-16]
MKTLLSMLYLALGATVYASNQPNVLFISVDDMNDFPAFANRYPDAKTPHMNRLAERGTVFANAHCQFPICGPSRASVMSGLHPSALGYDHHMKDNDLQERANEMGTDLLHSYFSKNGYTTLAIGKIYHTHVPENSVDVSGGREDFSEGTGLLKENWPQENTRTDWAMAPERDDQLPDFRTAQWTVEQLQAEHQKPFFMMVGFLRPHVPWYVPKKWFDLYDKDKLTLPAYRSDDLDDIPDIAKRISIYENMPRTDWAIENKQWRNILHAYLASISFADAQVGKVLDALDASPYRDNTIIVLWSDHGYQLGEKNTFQKHSLWDRSTHVPMIIVDPRHQAGQRSERVVSLLDLYPTLVELCDLPTNVINQGRSLVPLLKAPTTEWPYPAITGWKENSFSILNERYRYIRYGDGSEELYDHQNDLNEFTNMANNTAYNETKSKMAAALDSTLEQIHSK